MSPFDSLKFLCIRDTCLCTLYTLYVLILERAETVVSGEKPSKHRRDQPQKLSNVKRTKDSASQW